MNDKEKIEEAIRQIDEMHEAIEESRKKWLDTYLDGVNRTPKHSTILLEKAKFLGAVITDLENMKKTLES